MRLEREKAAMNRTWAKREKQIETIVSSTAKFTGELQALYGPSLPPVGTDPMCRTQRASAARRFRRGETLLMREVAMEGRRARGAACPGGRPRRSFTRSFATPRM
jgi:hypothetical protein